MLIRAKNPIIFADVPDCDVIRVEKNEQVIFYMASTTMHMTPGVPIMRSYDLVHWEIISYVYDQLEEGDAFALKNGKNDYSHGSWAPSIRYDEKLDRFFVVFSCQSTSKTYIYTTSDIEEGKWHRTIIEDTKCYDNSLFFEGEKKYILYANLNHMEIPDEQDNVRKVLYSSCCLRELFVDKETWSVSLGEEQVLIPMTSYENPPQGLWGEGYHAYKMNGYYYIFMIQGQHWQRQEIVWRSKSLLNGEWEKRKIFAGDLVNEKGEIYLASNGIAQGGIVQGVNGDWFAMLFQDYGAVGRMPMLIPVTWNEENWPVLGHQGHSADVEFDVAADICGLQQVVADDDFENDARHFIASDVNLHSAEKVTSGLTVEEIERLSVEGTLERVLADNEYGYNGSCLKPVWQWNHNPNNHLWSLTERKGWLRLKAGILTDSILKTRNMLTQRTIGPVSSAVICLDYAGLKEQDTAGLTALQNQYGYVGVTKFQGNYYVVMHRAMKKDDVLGSCIEKVKLSQDEKKIYLRIDCDFEHLRDAAYFYYSVNGRNWESIGDTLHMKYDFTHFMGYRFGLFLMASKEVGGYADFDFFHIREEILPESLKYRETEECVPCFVQPEDYRRGQKRI